MHACECKLIGQILRMIGFLEGEKRKGRVTSWADEKTDSEEQDISPTVP